MAKPKKVIRSIQKNIAIPEDLVAYMDLHLYSDLEGRVPFGAYSTFVSQLIREFFNARQTNSSSVPANND